METKFKKQRWNKKGLQFKLAFFAVIAISMAIIAIGVHLTEWNSIYNPSDVSNDLGEFNKLEGISSEVQANQDKLAFESPDVETNFEANTFRAAYGILTNIFAPFRLVFGEGGMLDSVTTRFGIPDYVRQGIVAMMVISFIFALVAIIFRIPGGSS